jgi:pyruvate/2-oxoglutarate/acetoin dehydrogenase E1 component
MVTALDTSVPYSEPMESFVLPSEQKIASAVKSVMGMPVAAD